MKANQIIFLQRHQIRQQFLIRRQQFNDCSGI